MSATNKTTHYELPVFVGGDMPGWLTDFNDAMNTIDGGIYEAKSAADGAQSSADTANANITTLAGTVDGVGGRVTTLEGTVASQGGNIDTINSLIGNGEPTTTDKTIIGAINELAAEMPTPGPVVVDADDVTYSNTTSGLTATNVQAAIDELETEIQAIQPGGGGFDFNLVNNVVATISALGSVVIDDSSVNVLTNADASIGKIYGGLAFHLPSVSIGNVDVATITASNLPAIDTAYDIIIGYAQLVDSAGASTRVAGKVTLHFNTNGTVTVKFNTTESASIPVYGAISLAPCLYFLKDLGD